MLAIVPIELLLGVLTSTPFIDSIEEADKDNNNDKAKLCPTQR